MHSLIPIVTGMTGFLMLGNVVIIVDDIANSFERWSHRNADAELRVLTCAGTSLKTWHSR